MSACNALFAFRVLNCVICESKSWLLVGFSGSCEVICATKRFRKSCCDNDCVGRGIEPSVPVVLLPLVMPLMSIKLSPGFPAAIRCGASGPDSGRFAHGAGERKFCERTGIQRI